MKPQKWESTSLVTVLPFSTADHAKRTVLPRDSNAGGGGVPPGGTDHPRTSLCKTQLGGWVGGWVAQEGRVACVFGLEAFMDFAQANLAEPIVTGGHGPPAVSETKWKGTTSRGGQK